MGEKLLCDTGTTPIILAPARIRTPRTERILHPRVLNYNSTLSITVEDPALNMVSGITHLDKNKMHNSGPNKIILITGIN